MFSVRPSELLRLVKKMNTGISRKASLGRDAIVITADDDDGITIGVYASYGKCYKRPVSIETDFQSDFRYPVTNVVMSGAARELEQVLSVLSESDDGEMRISPVSNGGFRMEGDNYYLEFDGIVKAEDLMSRSDDEISFACDLAAVKSVYKTAKGLRTSVNYDKIAERLYKGMYFIFDDSITIIGGGLGALIKKTIPNTSGVRGYYWISDSELNNGMAEAAITGEIRLNAVEDGTTLKYAKLLTGLYDMPSDPEKGLLSMAFDRKAFKNTYAMRKAEYLDSLSLDERKRAKKELYVSVRLNPKTGAATVADIFLFNPTKCINAFFNGDEVIFTLGAKELEGILKAEFDNAEARMAWMSKPAFLLSAKNDKTESALLFRVWSK